VEVAIASAPVLDRDVELEVDEEPSRSSVATTDTADATTLSITGTTAI
jgi:hypothetical protein